MSAGERWTGAKYADGRDVADVAKDIRADIRAAVKAGALPALQYSVKVARYAGGRSLTIRCEALSAVQREHVRVALETLARAYHDQEWRPLEDYWRGNFFLNIEVSSPQTADDRARCAWFAKR